MVGSIIIERRWRELGKLRIRSGTKKKKMAKAYADALDAAYAYNRLDVLRDLMDKKLTLQQVLEAHRTGKFSSLRCAADIRPLKTLHEGVVQSPVYEWLDKHTIKGKKDYRSYFDCLLKFAKDDDTVGGLAVVLSRMKDAYGEHPVMFNRTRAAVRSFVSHTEAKGELYFQVSAVKSLRPKSVRKGRHLDVAEVLDLMSKLPPHYQGMVWTMCLTGMRCESEYFADVWEALPKRHVIHVRGTKTSDSDRLIPLVEIGHGLHHKQIDRDHFGKQIRKASKRTVVPGDFRKTYAHWCEQAGISRTNRAAYMAHGKLDVQDIYELRNGVLVKVSVLQSDAEKLLAWLRPQLIKTNPNASKFFTAA